MEELDKYLNSIDISPIESSIITNNVGVGTSFSFGDLIKKAVAGELDFSPHAIFDHAIQLLGNEVLLQSALIRNLFIIAILSALIKNLTDSFKNKGVGELGFYVSYLALITVLFDSFRLAVGTMSSLIMTTTSLMEASIPLMLSLIVMTGSIGGAYAFHPIVFFVVNVAASFIKTTLMSAIVLGAGVQIVNYLTEQEILSKFAELIKNGCSLCLKVIIIIFMAALSLQRVGSTIVDNVVLKTARSVMGSVPVVGGILTGAADTVSSFADATKSGVSLALVIMIVVACAFPILKMVILVFVYKFTAAAIQPVCDARIVKCIDAIASFSLLILACGVSVAVMFLFSVMILLSF